MMKNKQETPHSITEITKILDQCTVGTAEPGKRVVNSIGFLTAVTKYLSEQERRIYHTGYNKGREFQRRLLEGRIKQ